jgi:hypothetical protein
MTFDERMAQIRSEITEMLATYAIPKHLDTENKVRQEIEGLARMVNHKLPSDTTQDHIRGTFERASMKLKSAHTSRTWPTGKDIDAAVTKSMTTSHSFSPDNKGPWKPDTLEINARRIRAGEPVGETYLTGKLAERMVSKGLVTEEQIAPYLVYLDANKRGLR